MIVSRNGTIYELRDLDSGVLRTAHVSQLARMRLMSDVSASKDTHTPHVAPPMTEEVLWDKLRVGTFVLFHMRADPKELCSVCRGHRS